MTGVDAPAVVPAGFRAAGDRPLRLLYVTEDVPNRDPLHGDGSSMIPYEVIRNLPGDVSVTLVTFPGEVPVPAEILERCDDVVVLPRRAIRAAVALSAVSTLSVGAALLLTRRNRAAVRRLSADVDVTLLHGPHASGLAGEVRGPLVVQVVDPWSFRMEMEAALVTGPRSAYRRWKARNSASQERALPGRARLLTVSGADATRWSRMLGRAVCSVPNGADPKVHDAQPPAQPTICFVGSLNYGPNVESATILVKEVAPLLWRRHPGLRVVLAGRQPVPDVTALAGGLVDVLPNVPAVDEVYRSSSVAVFPDRHGLGIRNSVREALACGVPVVATRSAAREQPPHPLLHVAADIDELVNAVDRVLANGGMPAAAAVSAVDERSWRVVAAEYVEECRLAVSGEELLSRV